MQTYAWGTIKSEKAFAILPLRSENFQTFQQINQLSKQQNAEKVCKFKNWHQPFIFNSNFKCETPNLIYVIICSGCNKEYCGQTGGHLKERLSIYRQHIRQPEYEKIEVERHFRTYAKGILKIFPFFKMKENKILRESCEDHFIKEFKPELNRRLQNPVITYITSIKYI